MNRSEDLSLSEDLVDSLVRWCDGVQFQAGQSHGQSQERHARAQEYFAQAHLLQRQPPQPFACFPHPQFLVPSAAAPGGSSGHMLALANPQQHHVPQSHRDLAGQSHSHILHQAQVCSCPVSATNSPTECSILMQLRSNPDSAKAENPPDPMALACPLGTAMMMLQKNATLCKLSPVFRMRLMSSADSGVHQQPGTNQLHPASSNGGEPGGNYSDSTAPRKRANPGKRRSHPSSSCAGTDAVEVGEIEGNARDRKPEAWAEGKRPRKRAKTERAPLDRDEDEDEDEACSSDSGKDGNNSENPWPEERDKSLVQLQTLHGNQWKMIAEILNKDIKDPARKLSRTTVKNRFRSILRAKRWVWTPEDDRKLLMLRQVNGTDWEKYLPHFKNRSKNAIRERYRELCRTRTPSEICAIVFSAADHPTAS